MEKKTFTGKGGNSDAVVKSASAQDDTKRRIIERVEDEAGPCVSPEAFVGQAVSDLLAIAAAVDVVPVGLVEALQFDHDLA